MTDDEHPDFSQAWSIALSKNPSWKAIKTASLVRKPESTENFLFATVLRSPDTIRAARTFIKQDRVSPKELRLLVSLGPGVSGIADICHGGIIALLLDEAMGALACEVLGRYDVVTGGLSVEYKRKLVTPAVVLCKSWVEMGEGSSRKMKLRGTVEDGEGRIYSTGHSVFIKPKEKL